MHIFRRDRYNVYLTFLVTLAAFSVAQADQTQPPSHDPAITNQAANPKGRFVSLFEPLTSEKASLSPKGDRLAFSSIQGNLLHVIVTTIDPPIQALSKVAINSSLCMRANIYNGGRILKEAPPLNIKWIGWVSDNRIAVVTDTMTVGPQLMSFNADGTNARVLVNRKTIPTGNNFSVFGLDRTSGSLILRTPDSGLNGAALYDVYYHMDSTTGKLKQIKESLAKKLATDYRASEKASKRDWRPVSDEMREILPNKRFTLIENDTSGNRHLGLVESMCDPGAFYVLDRQKRIALDIVRRIDDYDPKKAPTTKSFEFLNKAGDMLKGELSMPRESKMKHVPIVVIMPEKLNRKLTHSFSREACAFAQMGLATLRFESIIPQAKTHEPRRVHERHVIDSLVHIVDNLADVHEVSKHRIVLYGEQNAGYLALRALQVYPERFIGAIVVDPNLNDWDSADRWPETAGSPGRASGIRRPIFALATGRDHQTAREYNPMLLFLIKDAKAAGAPAEFISQPMDLRLKLPLARASAFREIERFVNTTMYDYVVTIGEHTILGN